MIRWAVLAWAAATPVFSQVAREYPSALVREEIQFTLEGKAETWRLEWSEKPRPECDSEASPSCPCMGFAYGESGDASLVRLRGGRELERLPLGPLFASASASLGEMPVLQRNQPRSKDGEMGAAALKRSAAERKAVQLIKLGDYDHDGRATEFYLQLASIPCGKSAGAVIGVSRNNPRLHALGTADAPDKPMVLQQRTWDMLRRARRPVSLVTWSCGDHGSEIQEVQHLRWSARGIEGYAEDLKCDFEHGTIGPVVERKPLPTE